MSVIINGDTGVSGVDGSAATPSYQGTDTDTGLFYSANTVSISAAGSKVATINAYGIGLGSAVPSSGIGITFPAAQSASSDANTLDDYEEGTWTPTAGGTSTYTLQSGQYIKIGKLVYINAVIIFTSLGTGSTTTLSGLPFTDGNVGGVKGGSCANFSGVATNVTSIFPGIDAGSSTIQFRSTTAASSSAGTSAIFGNSTRLDFNAFYFIS